MTVKLLFLVVTVIVVSECRPQLPEIPREFQNINLEQYLRNERAMKFQLKCVIYNGPCDTIGKFIKRNIPIYLRTQCKNCDEGQKKLAGKFITFLQENYPKEWDDAIAKYGKGTYTPEEIAQFEAELGVKITRDKNSPTVAPGTKPNIDGLVALTKEGLNAATNTKAPLILSQNGSATTFIVPKGTIPPQLGTTQKETATSSASPTGLPLVEAGAGSTIVTEEVTETSNATEHDPTEE